MTPFHQILGNNLVANVTNFTAWFAVTFWVFLGAEATDAPAEPKRVIALVFTAAGFVGVVATILAFNSRDYRQLSAAYAADAPWSVCERQLASA